MNPIEKCRKLGRRGKDRFIFLRIVGAGECAPEEMRKALRGIHPKISDVGFLTYKVTPRMWLVAVEEGAGARIRGIIEQSIPEWKILTHPPRSEEIQWCLDLCQEFLSKRKMNYSAREFAAKFVDARVKKMDHKLIRMIFHLKEREGEIVE